MLFSTAMRAFIVPWSLGLGSRANVVAIVLTESFHRYLDQVLRHSKERRRGSQYLVAWKLVFFQTAGTLVIDGTLAGACILETRKKVRYRKIKGLRMFWRNSVVVFFLSDSDLRRPFPGCKVSNLKTGLKNGPAAVGVSTVRTSMKTNSQVLFSGSGNRAGFFFMSYKLMPTADTTLNRVYKYFLVHLVNCG